MAYTYEAYDIAVIGAGHAGCEAALAGARTWAENDCIYSKHRKYRIDAM